MTESTVSEDNLYLTSLLSGSSGDDNQSVRLCFQHLRDSGCDGLTYKSFCRLLSALLVNQYNTPYHMPVQWTRDLFAKFDSNGDQIITWDEFDIMWKNWIQVILHPKSALIVVDVQNDFISGSLAINRCSAGHNGEEVIPVINQLIENISFAKVFYSQDWHPADHISFFDNKHIRKFTPIDDQKAPEDVRLYDTVVFEGPPPTPQKLWPTHCVQNTWGSALHSQLAVTDHSVRVLKGTNSHIDSYSVFWDNQRRSETNLNSLLQDLSISDVYVCGIATDVCVGFTALDASQYGYRTVLIDDASRGVHLEDIEAIHRRLADSHALVVHSTQVQHMVNASDRRPELAYHSALNLLPLSPPPLSTHL